MDFGPSFLERGRIYAIGDIHGRSDPRGSGHDRGQRLPLPWSGPPLTVTTGVISLLGRGTALTRVMEDS